MARTTVVRPYGSGHEVRLGVHPLDGSKSEVGAIFDLAVWGDQEGCWFGDALLLGLREGNNSHEK